MRPSMLGLSLATAWAAMAQIHALLMHGLAQSIAQGAQSFPAVHDTVYMKQVAVDHGFLDQVSTVASAVITVALMVLTVVAVPVAWNFRKTYKKVNHLLDRIYGDVTPIMRHASSITDNINFITTSLRTDVQRVNATIHSANERVQHAVALTEDRLNEFNALLAVIQEEAEQVFLTTASTVRGVRTGAAAFRERGGMDLASDELDPAEVAEAIERQLDGQLELDSEEQPDGDDGYPESTAQTVSATPRVRPRARHERRL
jgi:uncharacterized protein YoxC